MSKTINRRRVYRQMFKPDGLCFVVAKNKNRTSCAKTPFPLLSATKLYNTLVASGIEYDLDHIRFQDRNCIDTFDLDPEICRLLLDSLFNEYDLTITVDLSPPVIEVCEAVEPTVNLIQVVTHTEDLAVTLVEKVPVEGASVRLSDTIYHTPRVVIPSLEYCEKIEVVHDDGERIVEHISYREISQYDQVDNWIIKYKDVVKTIPPRTFSQSDISELLKDMKCLFGDYYEEDAHSYIQIITCTKIEPEPKIDKPRLERPTALVIPKVAITRDPLWRPIGPLERSIYNGESESKVALFNNIIKTTNPVKTRWKFGKYGWENYQGVKISNYYIPGSIPITMSLDNHYPCFTIDYREIYFKYVPPGIVEDMDSEFEMVDFSLNKTEVLVYDSVTILKSVIHDILIQGRNWFTTIDDSVYGYYEEVLMFRDYVDGFIGRKVYKKYIPYSVYEDKMRNYDIVGKFERSYPFLSKLRIIPKRRRYYKNLSKNLRMAKLYSNEMPNWRFSITNPKKFEGVKM